MPFYAQVACIGGNGLFALLFLFAAQGTLAQGNYGVSAFLLLLAVAAGYSTWVLLKFRHYLDAEAVLERELHVEKLQAELSDLRTKHEPPAQG